jgi:hypothetical protein
MAAGKGLSGSEATFFSPAHARAKGKHRAHISRGRTRARPQGSVDGEQLSWPCCAVHEVVRATKGEKVMRKHSKTVTVSVDTRAKRRLGGAAKAVSGLANALIFGSDDTRAKSSHRK